MQMHYTLEDGLALAESGEHEKEMDEIHTQPEEGPELQRTQVYSSHSYG